MSHPSIRNVNLNIMGPRLIHMRALQGIMAHDWSLNAIPIVVKAAVLIDILVSVHTINAIIKTATVLVSTLIIILISTETDLINAQMRLFTSRYITHIAIRCIKLVQRHWWSIETGSIWRYSGVDRRLNQSRLLTWLCKALAHTLPKIRCRGLRMLCDILVQLECHCIIQRRLICKLLLLWVYLLLKWVLWTLYFLKYIHLQHYLTNLF